MHYSTKSQRKVTSLFRENPSSSFSLSEIIASLPEVPKSSVYRIVDSLEKDGFIRKTEVTENRRALYQLSERLMCPEHMHIICTVCGKTIHIDEGTSLEIERMIEEKFGFSDTLGTLFRGKCSECRRKDG